VEFILRYAVLSYQYSCGDLSVIPYYALTTDDTHCIDRGRGVDLIFYRADTGTRNLITFWSNRWSKYRKFVSNHRMIHCAGSPKCSQST
jgi:hypothetical protein